MKHIASILATLVLALLAHVSFAQLQGAIIYETKVNMHRNLPKEREAMKDMIPEFRTTRQILTFNAQESLYKPLIDEEDDMAMEAAGGSGTRMVFRAPQTEIYTNTATSGKTSMREFMGKNYIIQDTLKVLPWKFGSETRTIQGYSCKQAVYVDEARNQKVVAWFTDQLRPALGPDSYNSLPGTVLEVDVNDGRTVTRATKIELRNLKKNELKEPSKGQVITEKGYQDMVAEQVKKMNSSGGIIIRN